MKEANIVEHGTAVFNGGAASILCSFPNRVQTNLGHLFTLEFFVDSFIGIVIWASLDSVNPFVSPTSVSHTIGLAYASMAWDFADATISTNLARDLGPRIVAAILVNVPTAVFATACYKFLTWNSLHKIAKGYEEHEHGEEGLCTHLKWMERKDGGGSVTGRMDQGGGNE
jgi:glycerol uptake facilitator-like aquaporin